MNRVWVGIVAVLALAACSKEPEPSVPQPDLDAGRAAAEADCADCHGMDGRGLERDIPNIAAQPLDYLTGALQAYKDGSRRHSALRDLAASMSMQQILDVSAFYSALPPLEPVEDDDRSIDITYRKGAEVAQICEDCHGPGGYSEEPGVPQSGWTATRLPDCLDPGVRKGRAQPPG